METKASEKINVRQWQLEIQNALKSSQELLAEAKKNKFPHLDYFPTDSFANYPVFITRDLFKEILRLGPSSLLWKQFIPHKNELSDSIQKEGLIDPIGDLSHQVSPQLIHRYKNRVLFLPTSKCPVQCRYCFRKNELHDFSHSNELFSPDFNQTLTYLLEHTEIEEIIFTGGDPFFLSDDKINSYLEAFSKIHHLKFIRFHTRFPSILPIRFESKILHILNDYNKRFIISIMIHTNSVSEWYSKDHYALLNKIKNSTFIWGSQTVLLKDHKLNDLVELFKFLGSHNIRPYYLHQMDKAKGAMHFFQSEEQGTQLYKQLRDLVPGWLIPHFIVDSPSSSHKRLVLDKN